MLLYRIYNELELDAINVASTMLLEDKISLGEYNQFIELINNGTYMKLINSVESDDKTKNIGGMELMKDKFVFDGIKMTDEKKSYGKVSEFDKGWENLLDKEDEEAILSDFKDYLSKLSERNNVCKLNTMRNPFMDALIDGFEKSFKEKKQSPEVDMSQFQSRLDLPLCPRRNNGDFNYDYSEWLDNRKEVCTKCNTLCPERETYIKDAEAVYNKNNQMKGVLKGIPSDFDSLPIEDDYAVEPEDCLYSYADVMRMLLNLSDIQIPKQKLMSMDDLELENYTHQIAKNNDSFKFKYEKIREIMDDIVEEESSKEL